MGRICGQREREVSETENHRNQDGDENAQLCSKNREAENLGRTMRGKCP